MARDCVVGLDIGTTKVCTIVAEIADSGDMTVVGVGNAVSHGIRKGVVVDIDLATHAINESVEKAKAMSGYDIHSVFVGVTGEHIASLNSRGVIAVAHPDREITRGDVEKVEEQAKVIVLPPDREMIHIIPRAYVIDGQNGIRNPIGMSGTRLEVETHIVTAATTFVHNVKKCVHKAGLGIEDLVLEPIATAESVLLEDEKNLGVVLADIGGGTTDIAIFVDGDICYSKAIPVGGNHVTRDISIGLRTSFEEAERIKLTEAVATDLPLGNDEVFPVMSLACEEPRLLPKRILSEIVEPRMHELFSLLKQEIAKSGYYNSLPAGIVLSGGGAQLREAVDLCRQVTGLPVHIGAPHDVGGYGETLRSPVYATAVGLVHYAARHHVHKRVAFKEHLLITKLQRWLNRIMGREIEH